MPVVKLKSIIIAEETFLKEKYPGLKITNLKNRGSIIEGELSFTAEMKGYKQISDSYDIKILLGPDFPLSLPLVYETSKKARNFHTNHGDHSLCLGAPPALFEKLNQNPSVSYLIEKLIIPFLYKASYKDKYNDVPGGELPHGTDGIAEYYSSEIKGFSKELILKFVQLFKQGKVKGHWNCPCGSGKKIRNCHSALFVRIREKIKDVPKSILKIGI